MTRDEFVIQHLPLVGYAYRRLGYLPAAIKDDVYSAGLEALVRCAGRFDDSRGVTFVNYAIVRIRGAMLDELRRASGFSAVRGAFRRGEEPPTVVSIEELAAESEDLALGDLLADDDEPTDEQAAAVETARRLIGAVEHLPRRDALVLRRYYWDHATMREIGDELDVSEVRVSQLHSSALYQLRAVRAAL